MHAASHHAGTLLGGPADRLLLRSGATSVLVALAALGALADPARATEAFAPCAPDSVTECAEIEVPLDRRGVIPGTIEISTTRQPAEHASRGTVIYLPGGPGNPGGDVSEVVGHLGPAGEAFDLIAFDPRGTGGSAPLSCPRLQRELRFQGAARAAAVCARRIGREREAFVSAEVVEDLEAIREAAGSDVVTLLGVSYGTVVAQAYAARYPERVERLILDSSLAPVGFDPFYRANARAIPRILQTLCRRQSCPPGSATKRLRKLASRLARGPLKGSYRDRDGRRRQGAVHAGRLLDLLLAGDFQPSFRSRLPRALAAFADRRHGPLLRLVGSLSGEPVPENAVNYAVQASAVCQETPRLPWPRDRGPAGRRETATEAVKQVPHGRLAPLNRAIAVRSDWLGLCARWPASPVPGLSAGTLPDVPALLVSGGADFRTPVEVSRRITRRLPRATHLVVPEAGHSVLSGRCTSRAVTRFLNGADVGRCQRP